MQRFDEARWTTPDMPLLSAYARELDNVRLAIGWSLEHDPRLAIALVGASSAFYILLGPGGRQERTPRCSNRWSRRMRSTPSRRGTGWLGRWTSRCRAFHRRERANEPRGCSGRWAMSAVSRPPCVARLYSGLFPRPMVGGAGSNGFACAGSMASSHEGSGVFSGSRDACCAGAFRRSTFGGRSRPRLHTIERDGKPPGPIHALAIIAEIALGRLDDALRRSRERSPPSVVGAVVLLRSHWAPTPLFSPGRVAVPRPAWRSQSFSRPAIAQVGTSSVSSATPLSNSRSRAALLDGGELLGYARKSWGRQSTQRRCAELLAALETVLDAETLERLLAEGEALDEEAVCALTLETGGCG